MKLEKHDILQVYDSFWVEVMNPNGIDNLNNHFNCGDLAIVRDHIKVIAMDYEKDRVLFEVCGTKGVAETAGTVAPNGTMFVQPLSTFLIEYEEAERKYNKKINEVEEIQDWIKAIKEEN